MTQHVVILTGGALPGQPTPDPTSIDLLAVNGVLHDTMTQLASLGVDTDHGVGDVLAAHSRAYWRAGWEQAAKLHRPAAVWVLGDEVEAGRFAGLVTEAADLAYVMPARSAMHEALTAFENKTGRVIS